MREGGLACLRAAQDWGVDVGCAHLSCRTCPFARGFEGVPHGEYDGDRGDIEHLGRPSPFPSEEEIHDLRSRRERS